MSSPQTMPNSAATPRTNQYRMAGWRGSGGAVMLAMVRAVVWFFTDLAVVAGRQEGVAACAVQRLFPGLVDPRASIPDGGGMCQCPIR